MANPIRRLVQLVLDAASALRMQLGAKQAIGGVQSSLAGLGRVARQVGGILAGIFGVRALIRFGVDAVRVATESEKVWKKLAGTVRNAGGDFEDMEANLRSTADAFQDVTVHGSEDYAATLDRLISLTGDVSASTNNMGLVANVAAQFFGNDLAPAADLVAKVMTGNITVLKRMGIEVGSAQEGLEVLAKRSFGQAEAATKTFGGRVAQLNERWSDFKKELGDVLIGADGTAGALDVLTGAVKTMAKWVKDNKDELRRWVKDGIDFAIGSLRTLFNLWLDFQKARGKASITTGNQAFTPATDAPTLQRQIASLEKQRQEETDKLLKLQAEIARIEGESIPQKMDELRRMQLERLHRDLGESADLLNQIIVNTQAAERALRDLGAPTKPSLFNPPQTGKFGKGEGKPKDDKIKSAFEDVTDAQKVLKEFGDRMMQIDQLAELLGDDFDKLGAEADALEDAIHGLTAAGVQASDNFLVKFRDRLALIGPGLDDFTENAMLAGSTLAEEMDEIALKARIWGDEFDDTGATIDALARHLEKVGMVMEQSDPRFQRYLEWLQRLREGSKKAAEAEAFRGEIAMAVAQAASAAMFGELGDVAEAKAKQNVIQALEYYALAAADILFGGGLRAGSILALAKTHTALAAMWGGLAAVSGGGGGAGGGLSSARGASGDSSRKVDAGPEVHIYIDPLDPRDPRAQSFVRSATDRATQRYGKNSRVTIHPRTP